MTPPLVEVQNVSKHFSSTTCALCQLNLSIPSGKMVGIVGPDGAGKSTLMRLIAALLYPSSGTVTVLGHDTQKQAHAIHRESAYMPQRFGLYEDLSVQQNLHLYARLRGVEEKEKKEIFASLLAFTGLDPFQKRLARDLSGGMKQKLGLACSLLGQPKLLILDEPSVGVDPISRRQLWSMVGSLLKQGVSVLWSTSYLEEAQECAHILLLNEGKLLYEGPPQELTQKLQGRVFTLLDGSENKREKLAALEQNPAVIDALIQGDRIRVVTQEGNFPEGEPAAPRLEDAFVELLGGKNLKVHQLSQAAPESPQEGEDRIIAKGLVKRFGTFTAVNQVSFSVKRGEIFGFLGPNGAGKSTTFKMLCGLLKPSEGSALINGEDITDAHSQARSKIGYMAQRFSLYGNLSVEQNLSFFMKAYHAQGFVEEKLDLFGLTEKRAQNGESLPLGYKQKLALAVATAHWPDVLFLDEPTSGMDPLSRRLFWSEMNGLVKKGKTILVSTHFMDEAENCDRIALIYQGLIIHLDTPERLKQLAISDQAPHPTLEDAFIHLIEAFDAKNSPQRSS